MIEMTGEKIRLPDSVEEINDIFYKNGWTDGLPIIPPTENNVSRMMSEVKRDKYEVIGIIPPKMGRATVEKIAINAVMAGCIPSYLPVIIAAVEAVVDPRYSLYGRQTTTHAGAPLIIVNGPVVKKLLINYGSNVFGPGWRANATIGRALRLILINIGGAIPGEIDSSTHGHPGKFTYCIAEDEDSNPWEPLHVERGYSKDTSTVTVLNAEAPHSINDPKSTSGYSFLTTCASTMATLGGNNIYRQGEPMLILGPEHARLLAREGWSKYGVKSFIFKNARQPVRMLSKRGMEIGKEFPKWVDLSNDKEMAPIAHRPEDIIIIVAGGTGAKSMCILTAGRQSLSVTKIIREFI